MESIDKQKYRHAEAPEEAADGISRLGGSKRGLKSLKVSKFNVVWVKFCAILLQLSFYYEQYPWHRLSHKNHYDRLLIKPNKSIDEQLELELSNQYVDLFNCKWFRRSVRLYLTYVGVKLMFMALLSMIYFNDEMKKREVNQTLSIHNSKDRLAHESCSSGLSSDCCYVNGALWLQNVLFGDPLRSLGPIKIVLYSFWAGSILALNGSNIELQNHQHDYNNDDPFMFIYARSRYIDQMRQKVEIKLAHVRPYLRSLLIAGKSDSHPVEHRALKVYPSFVSSGLESDMHMINSLSSSISPSSSPSSSLALIPAKDFPVCSMPDKGPPNYFSFPMSLTYERQEERFRRYNLMALNPIGNNIMGDNHQHHALSPLDKPYNRKALAHLLNFIPYNRTQYWHWSMIHLLSRAVMLSTLFFGFFVPIVHYALLMPFTTFATFTATSYYWDMLFAYEMTPFCLICSGLAFNSAWSMGVVILADHKCQIDQLNVNAEICNYLLELRIRLHQNRRQLNVNERSQRSLNFLSRLIMSCHPDQINSRTLNAYFSQLVLYRHLPSEPTEPILLMDRLRYIGKLGMGISRHMAFLSYFVGRRTSPLCHNILGNKLRMLPADHDQDMTADMRYYLYNEIGKLRRERSQKFERLLERLDRLIDKMMDLLLVHMDMFTEVFTVSSRPTNLFLDITLVELATLMIVTLCTLRYQTLATNEVPTLMALTVVMTVFISLNLLFIIASILRARITRIHSRIRSMVAMDVVQARRLLWLNQIDTWFVPKFRLTYKCFEEPISYVLCLRLNLWIISALILTLEYGGQKSN